MKNTIRSQQLSTSISEVFPDLASVDGEYMEVIKKRFGGWLEGDYSGKGWRWARADEKVTFEEALIMLRSLGEGWKIADSIDTIKGALHGINFCGPNMGPALDGSCFPEVVNLSLDEVTSYWFGRTYWVGREDMNWVYFVKVKVVACPLVVG